VSGGQFTFGNVIRKFTSNVASQTYQFARQFYGEEKKARITEKEKTRTGKLIAIQVSFRYHVVLAKKFY
jgi:hypothetical protein